MSSNQNKSSAKRISSIRRQLASKIVWGKIGVCFGHDLLLMLLLIFVWMCSVEINSVGNIEILERHRVFTNSIPEKEIRSIVKERDVFKEKVEKLNDVFVYRVYEKDTDAIIAESKFIYIVLYIFGACSTLFFVQAVVRVLELPAANRTVRRILKPIDELALRADEIAKYDFTEDKYHLIEETLTNMAPNEEERISLGDQDLVGIENAMNNLIARIKQSNRQQARFVNDASHELRTPIAVIQGYANMLSRWGREDEKVLDESIVAIKNEADNMQRLVEQLLFLARGDAGRTAINKENINLNELVREVYEESLMIDEGHVYKMVCPEEQIYVNADEGLIKQAARILVDNAAKYTNEKDEIIISCGIKDNDCFLQVQDTGIGMKEADVEHVFERFYRSSEARSYDGTGLGLSIAKWIIDKHQGHFEIVSREGLGTRIGMYMEKVG